MIYFLKKTAVLRWCILLSAAVLLINFTGFGQKNAQIIPTDETLRNLVNKHIKSPVSRQVQPDGSVFLQRNFTEYLHASPAFNDPEPQANEADFGHDHKMEALEIALNRPHPSVATLEKYFKAAASSYKVPVALLRAYAQVQSNWTQVSESMYGSWGIMGLTENPYTHQLAEAAALLGTDMQQIKTDANTNIRAAAALLAQYQSVKGITQNPEDWFGSICRLTGMPEKDLQASLAQRVYRIMAEGTKTISIWGEIILIEKSSKIKIPAYEDLEPSIPITLQGNGVPDYPAAILNYTTCNFSNRPTGAGIRYYFVHYIAVGTYEGTISWFKNCTSQVSAHYVVRNFDGQVTQMVDEANRAWSQGVTEYNDQGIGVEHEVQVANLSMWDSQPMLNEAGKLCADACNRNNIPKQRRGNNGDRGIYGHSDVIATNCPNLTTNRWNTFLSKVLGALPAVGTPTLWSVQSATGNTTVTATWRSNTEATLLGYRLYYAQGDDLNNWALAANETTLTPATNTITLQPEQFMVPATGLVYHYRLTALVSNGAEPPVESGYSDMYSASTAASGKKVLIVDGFDRSGGSYKVNVHSFAVSYFKAMRDRGLVQISTAANEKVEDGTISLTGYDLVVWFVGDESSADVVFSANEKARITAYLNNGGQMLISGSEIAYNLGRAVAAGFDINFMTNYLKATYVNDGNPNFTPASGTAGSAFEGLNIPFGIVYPEDFPDAISPVNGSVTLMDYIVAPNKAAIGYKGTFGAGSNPGSVLFLAFPLETASDQGMSAFFEKAFPWFGVEALPAPPITQADATKVKEGKTKRIYLLNNDNGNGLPLNPQSLTLTTAPTQGTVKKAADGYVIYKANAGYNGPDVFQYKIANTAGVFSGNETVSINIETAALCGDDAGEVDDAYPLRSLRGAWVTSVFNLDWPTRAASPAVQQAELLTILDTLKNTGFNTIYLQVRTGSDAFYASNYEPWSFYLTGTEGTAPSPLWDPLTFAVEAAHARGLDLHAWINPYRARTGSYPLAAGHVINQRPDWILTVGTNLILNPGLPEVRNYLKNIMADIAARYDVDGIHFDDYFYPTAISTQDNATYATNNPSGFGNIGDWRRDNVNQMIAMVYDTIQHINTIQNRNVVFGVSPFGIWKAGTPPGIAGTSSFSAMYCDPIAWLQAGKVDYVAPQLYWKITGAQDYNSLSLWWNGQATLTNRHLYTGQAWYKMVDVPNNWAASEIEAQISMNRQPVREAIRGEIGYRTLQIMNNSKGLKTALQQGLYRYKSYAPPMSWKDAICPNAPANVRVEGDSLRWDAPTAAADGDFAIKYVVYKYSLANEAIALAHDGTKVIEITRRTALYLPNDRYATYVVSALDKNNNESAGTIGKVPDITLCPGTNITLQGMVSGNQFVWQILNGEVWENLTPSAVYSGTNSYELLITQLPVGAYGTQIRCLADGTTPGPVFTLTFANIWTGTENNLWGNLNNWSCGEIPTSNTDVIVPGNVIVFPMVDILSAFARRVWLQNNAQLTVAPGNHLDIRKD